MLPSPLGQRILPLEHNQRREQYSEDGHFVLEHQFPYIHSERHALPGVAELQSAELPLPVSRQLQ